MKNLFGVLGYVKGYWRYGISNIIFNIIAVIFSLFSLTMAIPLLDLLFQTNDTDYVKTLAAGEPAFHLSVSSLSNLFNYRITYIIVQNGKLHALLMMCLLITVVILFKNFFRYMAMYFLSPIRNGVVKDFRNAIFKKSLDLPLSYYSEERKGDIMSRITTDVQEIEWSIMSSLEMIFRDPFNIVIFLATLIFMSPQLSLFVFVLLPITGGLIALIGKSLKRTSAQAKEKLGTLFSIMEETLGGLRIIKGFNAEKMVGEKFQKENQGYTRLMIKTYRKVDLSSPMSEFLGTLVMMVVMYFGGKLVLSPAQTLKPSEFIDYVIIFSQIIPPAKSLTTAYYNVQKGLASIDRINKILDAEISIRENENPTSITTFQQEIAYKNVSFAYRKGDTGWVLRNINLKIEKGKTIALVGQSGSGKSTMADMLPRFYDIDEGDILIDNHPIKNLKIKDLRALMGIVTQESILFNDTIFNNIAFGMQNVTEEKVIEAAKIANAHDFIMQTENGYLSNIGDRGSKLSGGQRQRLSIARAVLKNPPILILDEATSALDTESERLVQDALNKLMKNRTSLVIAHRLSTIQHADEIIVLQKGEIIERGNHAVLLAKNGAYKKLYDMQAFL
ncbi:MAG: ABC transporter ATP-binding protein [Bacteroidia bacterium]